MCRTPHPSPENFALKALAIVAWGAAPGPGLGHDSGLKARAKSSQHQNLYPQANTVIPSPYKCARASRPSIPLLLLPLLLIGCKSAPLSTPAAVTDTAPAANYPARPTTAPAQFKTFHHANSSFTLVVPEKASNDEISALVWQLRDAARTHSFDKLHIPQKQVDADGSTVWFHIYRGTKCAPEKYAPGNPPCGASYHAAGDYTLAPTTKPPWDKGVLHNSNAQQTDLWNPDAPYTGPSTR